MNEWTFTVVTFRAKYLQHNSETVTVSVTNGIYLERWDRIDYKRVKFLLKDPRYPRLPSATICLPDFQQPQSWADYFGARARTYFVPQETGIYHFMLCKGILVFKLLPLSCLTGFDFKICPRTRKLAPGARFSKGPVTFWVQRQIWKSKPAE